MLGLGYAARQVGRRMGSLTTATLMTMGAWGLALSSLLIDSEHPVALFRCTSLCLFVFGVGVGGEYPLAASSASEVAMGAMQHKLRLELEREERATIAKVAGTGVTGTASAAAVDGLSVIKETEDDGGLDKDPLQRDRGRQIQLVFTMQGMGILVNSLTITFLLLVTGQTGNQYNDRALLFIWRAVYVVGALILSYVLYSRWKHLQESTVWLDDKRRREQLTRHTLQDMTSEGGSGGGGGGGGGIAPVTPHVPSPVNSERNDVFRARSRVSSGMSDISSLSCPSVELGDGIIKEVPSTDPEDDLQTHHLRLLWRNYGVRLIGASLAWMLWDGTCVLLRWCRSILDCKASYKPFLVLFSFDSCVLREQTVSKQLPLGIDWGRNDLAATCGRRIVEFLCRLTGIFRCRSHCRSSTCGTVSIATGGIPHYG